MKYMLLMSRTKAEFDAYVNWPREDPAESVSFMRSFAKELEDTGVLVLTMGLGFPNEATLVRAGADGEPVGLGAHRDALPDRAGAGRRTENRNLRRRSPRTCPSGAREAAHVA